MVRLSFCVFLFNTNWRRIEFNMVDVKRSYESVVVISTKIGEDKIKEIVEKIKKLISDNGELSAVDEWGKRNLAYPINYEKEGYYVLFNFKSAPSFSAELSRIYGITDGVIRTLLVTKDN